MPGKSWNLADATELHVGPGDIGGLARGCSVKKRTLHGGLSEGVETVEVDNGTFRFVVLPTRGMGVWKAWLGDFCLGWNSPVRGPVHPAFVPLAEPSGLGWLDGFDELLCRCGLLSNGAPDFDERGALLYPLHGRIANTPAHKLDLTVDGDTGEISLTCVMDEVRFHFQKLRLTSTVGTKVGEPGFRIIDEVTNLSGVPAEAQLLYHINFGPPLLEAGAKVVAPLKTLVPRDAHTATGVSTWNVVEPPQAGEVERCFFSELNSAADGWTRTLLKNASGTRGVSLRYDTRRLPCFSLWKNPVTEADGYVVGLEPATNFPNRRTHEQRQGRVLKLQPGETVRFELTLEVHGNAEQVRAAEQAVLQLQTFAEPKVFNAPQPGWCLI